MTTKEKLAKRIDELLQDINEQYGNLDHDASSGENVSVGLFEATVNYFAAHVSLYHKVLDKDDEQDVPPQEDKVFAVQREEEDEGFNGSPKEDDGDERHKKFVEEDGELIEHDVEVQEEPEGDEIIFTPPTVTEAEETEEEDEDDKEEVVTEEAEEPAKEDVAEEDIAEEESDSSDGAEDKDPTIAEHDDEDVEDAHDPGELSPEEDDDPDDDYFDDDYFDDDLDEEEESVDAEEDKPSEEADSGAENDVIEGDDEVEKDDEVQYRQGTDFADSDSKKANGAADVREVTNEVVIEEREITVPAEKVSVTDEPARHAEAPQPSRPLSLNEILSAQRNKTNTPAYGAKPSAPERVKDIKSAISLNDKLLFIKDLFNGYSLAYSEAIELLNRHDDFKSAQTFLESNYAEKNNWAEKPDTVEKLYAVMHKRFG